MPGQEPGAQGSGGGAGGRRVAAVARRRCPGGRARMGAAPRRIVREARQGRTLFVPSPLSVCSLSILLSPFACVGISEQ